MRRILFTIASFLAFSFPLLVTADKPDQKTIIKCLTKFYDLQKYFQFFYLAKMCHSTTWGCCDPQQDLALGFVESHITGLDPSAKEGGSTLQQINILTQLAVSANRLRAHWVPLSKPLIMTLNRTGPSAEPWGTPLVTSHQVEVPPFTTTLWA